MITCIATRLLCPFVNNSPCPEATCCRLHAPARAWLCVQEGFTRALRYSTLLYAIVTIYFCHFSAILRDARSIQARARKANNRPPGHERSFRSDRKRDLGFGLLLRHADNYFQTIRKRPLWSMRQLDAEADRDKDTKCCFRTWLVWDRLCSLAQRGSARVILANRVIVHLVKNSANMSRERALCKEVLPKLSGIRSSWCLAPMMCAIYRRARCAYEYLKKPRLPERRDLQARDHTHASRNATRLVIKDNGLGLEPRKAAGAGPGGVPGQAGPRRARRFAKVWSQAGGYV